MKAAVCTEFGAPLAIEDLTLAAPGPGEIRVRIRACAICHSDLISADGGWGGTPPAVFGHEAAGEVIETGAAVRSLQVGDRVIVTLIRSCGQCRCCANGKHIACETRFALDETSPLRRADGTIVGQGMRTAAFAQEVVVEQSQVVKFGEDLDFDVASLLACGVITGLGAVTNTAQLRPGDTAAVVGLGGVGLSAVQGARLAGAETIIGIDIEPSKLETAKSFGATHGVLGTAPDLAAQMRELTAGRGVDFVFVCAGVAPIMTRAFDYLAPTGALLIVGMPASGVMAEYEPAELAGSAQRVIGSKMGNARVEVDIPALESLYRQGRLKLDEMISGRYRLEEINEAIAASRSGASLRNVLIME